MLLLDNNPFGDHFDGATVRQAFLSVLSYHRWHAQTSRKSVKTRRIDALLGLCAKGQH